MFVDWLLGKNSLTEIGYKYGVTRQTLYSWFKPFWNEEPKPKNTNFTGKVLVIDGK
ncbi:MAG: helix-turn-helix domain-containing protein [Patescibacteria group bacterium]|nr:helix-turn-helix domain-containing protein [Patescibacteria group bacterium]